jgi:LysM repeat protein
MSTVAQVFCKRIILLVLVGAPLLLAVACTQNTLTCGEGNTSAACRVPFGNNDDLVTGSIQPRRIAPATTASTWSPPIDRPNSVISLPQPRQPNAVAARRQAKVAKPVHMAHRRRPATCDVTGSIPLASARAFPLLSDAHWERDERNSVVVRNGDTIKSLSHRHGVPEAAIREANALGPNEPQPGEVIMIPHYNIYPVATIPRREATTSVSIRPAAPAVSHVVQPGETLSAIAQRYHTSAVEIARLNGIGQTTHIRSGASLQIPPS